MSILSLFFDRIASDRFVIRQVAQEALGRLLTAEVYDPLAEEKSSSYGITQEKYMWLTQLPGLVCWTQCKEILWQSFTKVIGAFIFIINLSSDV